MGGRSLSLLLPREPSDDLGTLRIRSAAGNYPNTNQHQPKTRGNGRGPRAGVSPTCVCDPTEEGLVLGGWAQQFFFGGFFLAVVVFFFKPSAQFDASCEQDFLVLLGSGHRHEVPRRDWLAASFSSASTVGDLAPSSTPPSPPRVRRQLTHSLPAPPAHLPRDDVTLTRDGEEKDLITQKSLG